MIVLALSILPCCNAPTDLSVPSEESAKMGSVNRADDIPVGPVAFVAAQPLGKDNIRASALAILAGPLVIYNGCLVVKTDNGEFIQPIFDPARAFWNPTDTKLLYDNREYSLGDTIELGGGLLPPSLGDRLAGQGVNICANIPLFGVS
jgi:hypothetical protein